MLDPRLGVATAVDQVVPASHDSWTPIVELLQLVETKASVSRTSRPAIESAWPVPGVGIADPPDSSPKAVSCWRSPFVFSVA